MGGMDSSGIDPAGLEIINDPELRGTLERLERVMMQRTLEETKQTLESARQTAQVIQLPLWPESVRGAPNSFLRSALFAAIQGKGRRALKYELLGSIRGITIKFTGWQLDQSDLDVWEQAVHLARLHPLGNICQFTANAFLKAIGRSNGKRDYAWLHGVITRLVACAVEIRRGSKIFTGSLLSSCARDEATGIYKMTLDPDMIKLYGSADWTGIEWDQRQQLRSKPLALWLHGYYASHAAPLPVKVETLRMLSGSRTAELWKFRQLLRTALGELEIVGAIEAWEIDDNDLVHISRGKGITDSQRRHLVHPKGSGSHKK
jgi:hypothetical protein